jgi:hypothetical protein
VPSIHFERHYHFKNGDVDLKAFFVVEIFHGVGAIHLPHLGAEVTAADILISFTGVKNRLDSYDALPLHFPGAAVAVEDVPVTAMKFDGKVVMIFDSNAIGKHIFTGNGIRIIRLVKGLDAHLHSF